MPEKLNTATAIAVIGIDIGKNSFHMVGQDRRGALGACPDYRGAEMMPRLEVGLAERNRRNPGVTLLCHAPYLAPAAIGNAADRLRPWANFKRLWTVQTMAHSPRTFSKPRSRN